MLTVISLEALAIWFVIPVLALANGGLRESVLMPLLGSSHWHRCCAEFPARPCYCCTQWSGLSNQGCTGAANRPRSGIVVAGSVVDIPSALHFGR